MSTFNVTVSNPDQINVEVVPEAQPTVIQVGEQGPEGIQGPSGTLAIGTVTSLPPGTTPTVVNVGTAQAAILNFGLEKGDAGDVVGIYDGGKPDSNFGGIDDIDGGTP
jgi:hypothetical protein